PVLWRRCGAVRRAWVAASLRAARQEYDDRLAVRVGNPCEVLPALVSALGAASVHVSRETTPFGVRRDAAVSQAVAAAGADWAESGTPYAVGPGLVRNGSGAPYQVFTPFARAWREHG